MMPFDTALLKAEQLTLAAEICCQGVSEDMIPRFIAGGDVGFEQHGRVARAAFVILSWPQLQIVEYRIARTPVTLPYIPGFLSFREYPALLDAWQQLTIRPDLVFIDGHGISHPHGLGIASHFGLLADIPTIGVAKRRLCGEFQPPGEIAGSCQPLNYKHQCVGWVLRSKIRCNPLFISVGHKISHQMALFWTRQCLRDYRLPEPTRWADAVASQRPAFRRWLSRQ